MREETQKIYEKCPVINGNWDLTNTKDSRLLKFHVRWIWNLGFEYSLTY